MTATSPPTATNRLADLGPGILAASMFATSNVLSKLVLNAGADVLTLSLFRGVVGVALLSSGSASARRRSRTIRASAGSASASVVIFAGVVFGLFTAFAKVSVPIGILSYFVYPLITGFLGMLLGIERIGWRGALAALAAFGGLALTIRANPHDIALAGVAFSFMAACGRTAILLITRATLAGRRPADDDLVHHPRLDRGARRHHARRLGLAGARHDRRLGGDDRGQLRHHHRGAVAVRVDQADRPVPQRADHVS